MNSLNFFVVLSENNCQVPQCGRFGLGDGCFEHFCSFWAVQWHLKIIEKFPLYKNLPTALGCIWYEGGSEFVHFNSIQSKFLCFQQGTSKRAEEQLYAGLLGGHGPGYMVLATATWTPMGARVPVLSPNDN